MSATVTIPSDLGTELDEVARYRHMTVGEVVESALRLYLANHQRWGGREYRPATLPFEITPLVEIDDQGEQDVSISHDRYLA